MRGKVRFLTRCCHGRLLMWRRILFAPSSRIVCQTIPEMISNIEKIDMGAMGKRRFCRFCHVIKKLLIKRKLHFELIIAVGNSGISMGRFTELIYNYYHLEVPPRLNIPFYRFIPGFEENTDKLFDSRYYLDEIISKLKRIDTIENVLFVDDEIGKGITAIGLFKLINEALERLNKPRIKSYYIVAEDQGFKPPQCSPEIKFAPYDFEVEGHFNAIFYTTPLEYEKPIVAVLGDDNKFAFHKRTNLLFGLPVKDFNFGEPIYTDKFLKLVERKKPDFKNLQKKYQKYIVQLVETCLNSKENLFLF